ncbi:MAG: CAP domain-containing protein [Clostridium sp.]|uniref:CAP domain-containing protein n=1 Tax=Clostridium sp. TaxID=1506 RepID=UPI002A760134|nr:CAP domain-containing protein [Clostridium sp.]MCI6692485.1 CAP domain-containing protein [Clostridium sp.]MDY2631430.1 CAP domain-containing protein [Clostridium sp.]MDY4251415.1 CAP domain-containing protein [Clostridium sp.]
MIKSKLIMVISSIGLVVTLGVGGIFVNSNKEISQDNTVKTEEKEETSKDVVKEEGNDTETSNNFTSEEADLNKEVVTKDDNISLSDEVDNSTEEEESGVEGVSSYKRPSNRPSYNKPSTPSDKPSQDTNKPSETPSNESIVSDSNYIAEIEQAIFQRVNTERTAAGLPALSYNTTMEHYARIKSKDMGDNGYFSHEDKQGNLITAQMKADGVSYRAWGENIAYIQGINSNSALATKFMDNWMNSSGHRANILSTNFSSIGIGVYKIGNTYYATQEFYK